MIFKHESGSAGKIQDVKDNQKRGKKFRNLGL